MSEAERRYFVRAPGGKMIAGFDLRETAEFVALEYGNGACLIDTLSQAYYPMAQGVEDGALSYLPIGGWDSGRHGLEHDLIEAIKKGHAGIVHAFLAKGADPCARDANGGPALVWAAAAGNLEIVSLLLEFGADAETRDADGTSAADIAEKRGRTEIGALLEKQIQDRRG